MKRKYIEDDKGEKIQCWVGDKLIWTKNDEAWTVFFHDDEYGMLETSVLYPKTRKTSTTNRGPKWGNWRTHHTDNDETFDDWESGSWLKNAERDAFRIPSAFFTSGYETTKDWCDAIERSIVDIEAKHEEG